MQDVNKRRPGATDRARALRAGDTEPEYRLWGELRSRRLNGFKFARQIPIGPFLVDFVCRQRHLVIELDGSQHSDSTTDASRTAYLIRHGYSVLRFWNEEVLRERRAVLDTILAALQGELAPSPGLRFARPPSPRGERRSERSRLNAETSDDGATFGLNADTGRPGKQGQGLGDGDATGRSPA
jgi:very-short-patch-repair endonuclease